MGAFSYIHGQLGIGCRAELYLDSFFDRYRGYHLNWTIFVPTLRHYNKCIYFGSKEKLQYIDKNHFATENANVEFDSCGLIK